MYHPFASPSYLPFFHQMIYTIILLKDEVQGRQIIQYAELFLFLFCNLGFVCRQIVLFNKKKLRLERGLARPSYHGTESWTSGSTSLDPARFPVFPVEAGHEPRLGRSLRSLL